jgi:hypothetical protein
MNEAVNRGEDDVDEKRNREAKEKKTHSFRIEGLQTSLEFPLTDRVIQLRVCDIQNKWARMK